MKKKNIAVIFGGRSSEYEVSLKSAHSVISNMNKELYETIMIGITREGNWFRYYGDIAKIPQDTWHLDKENCIPASLSPSREIRGVVEFVGNGFKITDVDAVFPMVHGKYCEDGTLQGLIEMAGIPLIGCGTMSSALCMDKDRAHKLAALAGVKTPKSVVFTSNYPFSEMLQSVKELTYPLFVKPVKAGSSFGITKVCKEEQLIEAVMYALTFDNEVIIEENIEGFEVGCAVMGNDELVIGEIDEIELADGFFDYTEKYTLKSSKIHMPARIEKELAKRVKETAAVIYKALGCSVFARVDMFITPDREIVFNEVNTIPGFTTHSRYPNMLKGIGMEFGDIVDRLIELGIKK